MFHFNLEKFTLNQEFSGNFKWADFKTIFTVKDTGEKSWHKLVISLLTGTQKKCVLNSKLYAML